MRLRHFHHFKSFFSNKYRISCKNFIHSFRFSLLESCKSERRLNKRKICQTEISNCCIVQFSSKRSKTCFALSVVQVLLGSSVLLLSFPRAAICTSIRESFLAIASTIRYTISSL